MSLAAVEAISSGFVVDGFEFYLTATRMQKMLWHGFEASVCQSMGQPR